MGAVEWVGEEKEVNLADTKVRDRVCGKVFASVKRRRTATCQCKATV